MEATEEKARAVAAKLDMSLDDLIASQTASQRSRGSTRTPRGFERRFRGYTPNFDARQESRLRRGPYDDLAPKRFISRPETRMDGDWRTNGGRQRTTRQRLRSRTLGLAESDENSHLTPGGMQDVNGAMSDGEIPTSPSVRRQLILEGRRRQAGLSRRFRLNGRLLRISGLDYSILQSDLKELFLSIGPVEKCWIDYDRTDRSLGTGGVIYASPADARLALESFDGRLIDGQPLHLEMSMGR